MTKHYIAYGVLIIIVLTAGIWIAKQEIANARAEERSKAHEDAIKQINDLQAQSHAELKTALDALAAEKAKPATVQTVTKLVTIPVPQGSAVEVKKADGQPCSPDGQCGQGQVILTGDTQTNLNWIRNMEVAHLECDKKLDGCQKDVTAGDNKLKLMTEDRDNWKDNAKGGSKWVRARKALTFVACAGGGAAVGSIWKTKGAAIGAAAGVGACQIVF